MTDNDVVRALECSPLDDIGGCRKIDALDLIKRQKAEIERLNIRNKTLSAITRNYDWKFSNAKSEAIKEFSDRVINEAYDVNGVDVVDVYDIYGIAKQLTEHKETVSMIDGHIEE